MWNSDSWFCRTFGTTWTDLWNLLTHATKSKTCTLDFGGTCKTCKHIHATKSNTYIWEIVCWLVKLVNAFMLQNQRQALGTWEILVKLVNTFMLQNQRQADWHLGNRGLTCETCKRIHATKSKTCTWDFGGSCKTCKHIHATKSKAGRLTFGKSWTDLWNL